MYSNFFKRYYIKVFVECLVQQWNIKDTLKVVFLDPICTIFNIHWLAKWYKCWWLGIL